MGILWLKIAFLLLSSSQALLNRTESPDVSRGSNLTESVFASSTMSGPVAEVKQGTLRGAVVDNVDGGTYIFFRGIPFAEPPVGDLRFKDPQPPTPWTGIWDASKEGPSCGQINMSTKLFEGDDDCLYLNVATTALNGSRPVMVWIHGGAFVLGSAHSEMYRPDHFLKRDIVFVSINYRIGCLGFLNLDHEQAAGNQGLKDQVAALKWVKGNIEAFGGDPNNITIFGVSAGGASVHYQTMSPLSKGLFHKAISQSGVALNPWAFKVNPSKMGYRLAAELGKETSDPIEAVNYLRSIPVEDLIKADNNLSSPLDQLILNFAFGPSVDDKSSQPFLPRPPAELAVEGVSVPLILGYNSHEGLLFFINGGLNEIYSYFNETLNETVPTELAVKAPSKVAEIAQEIKKLYFGDEPITKDQKDNFVQFMGDLYFSSGIQRIVDLQALKNTTTFLYKFAFEGAVNFGKKLFNIDANGTAHADEISYMFHVPELEQETRVESGTPERKVLDRFVQMWTDFAKTGNPTPKVDELITEKWLPVTSTAKNYLVITENLKARVNVDKEKWESWQRIYAMA